MHLKTLLSLPLSLLMLLSSAVATFAQNPVNAQGTVRYSLPNTVVHLKVTAAREDFFAGPYAAYARKYLGTEAVISDQTRYSIAAVDMVPYIEADPDESFTVKLTAKQAGSTDMLQMCAQGLIALPDAYTGKEEPWRFPTVTGGERFAGKDASGNLTSATTTLYHTVKTGDGFRKVPLQQSEVVEKSLEKKAAEAAQMIFDLRKTRIQILTGDTDATYSGEALGAAVAEIARLEADYLSLFYGVTETSYQQMHFDVLPVKDKPGQIYVAFRISETDGLLPAEEMQGRPVTLEFKTGGKAEPAEEEVPAGKVPVLYYRVPAIATVRLMDAGEALLQTRMPVYQLGEVCSWPLK